MRGRPCHCCVAQEFFEVAEVHAAICGEPGLNDGREPLAPRHLVRVVLVGADEDDGLMRTQRLAKCCDSLGAEVLAEEAAYAAARGGRERDPEDLLELVDSARRARTARDNPAARPGVDGALDDGFGLVEEVRRHAARRIVLGVTIGVEPGEVGEIVLDEAEATARGGEVRVDHQPLAEGRRERRIHAERLRAEGGEVEGGQGHQRGRWVWVFEGTTLARPPPSDGPPVPASHLEITAYLPRATTPPT